VARYDLITCSFSHDLSVWAHDHVACLVMKSGQIVEQGATADVFDHLSTPTLQKLPRRRATFAGPVMPSFIFAKFKNFPAARFPTTKGTAYETDPRNLITGCARPACGQRAGCKLKSGTTVLLAICAFYRVSAL